MFVIGRCPSVRLGKTFEKDIECCGLFFIFLDGSAWPCTALKLFLYMRVCVSIFSKSSNQDLKYLNQWLIGLSRVWHNETEMQSLTNGSDI